MAHCPLCHTPVKDDFGLIECGGCGAQLIVHVDGRVEYQDASVPAGDADAIDEEAPTQMVGEESQRFRFASAVRELDPEEEEQPPGIPEPTFDENDFSPPVEDEPPAPDQFASQEEVYAPPATQDSPDLKDIAGFGNSDLSGARDGSLRYTLFVEGIDTSDVRHAFREALTDRKLMWDTDQILRSLKHGEVKITNVSASKAYILISRLRTLPVRVRWEQYAVHQT
jgi:hypothetical protein